MPTKWHYYVVWESILRSYYLQEFLPGGIPRWTKKIEEAKKTTVESEANVWKVAAHKGMKRQGIAATIEVIEL